MYSAPITRENPTAFFVLIDQSGSMAGKVSFAGSQMPKSRAVSLVAGSFVDELLHRAQREDGVRDYYDISVLGYSGAGVLPLIEGRPSWLAAKRLTTRHLSQERMLPGGRSVLTVSEHRAWIEERAESGTPMCAALGETLLCVEKWCRKHPMSYPPTIINITDGEASDGSSERVAELFEKLKSTGTRDGASLVINIHLVQNDGVGSVLFPSSVDELPGNRYARLLWEGSSELPFRPGARGIGFNCDFAALAAAMNIGSINSVML